MPSTSSLRTPRERSRRRRALEATPLTLVLFGFWLLLSGELDALHLTLGAATAAAVAAITEPLLMAPPAITATGAHPFKEYPLGRLLAYLPWLVVQVVVSSLQVARLVLHPSLPIAPRIVRLAHPLPHNLARLTLANSITLTPGTVTIDVDGDEYLVHALTPDSARGLAPEAIPRRVAALFGAEPR